MKIRLLSAGLLSAGLLFANAGNATLLTNGNFDAQDVSAGDIFGSTGWGAFNDSFTTSSDSGANSPVADSLNNVFKAYGAASGARQTFAASAGQTYAGNGVGQNFNGDPLLNNSEAFLQIVFRDINGGFAGTAAGGSFAPGFNVFDGIAIDAASTLDVWHILGVGTAPAPDNTAFVDFNVLVLASSGGAGFIDSTCFTLVVPGDPSPACNAVPLPAAGVPEPSVLAILALGLAGLGWSRRKKEINGVRLD